jgi:hypothetical protein
MHIYTPHTHKHEHMYMYMYVRLYMPHPLRFSAQEIESKKGNFKKRI